MIKVLAINGSYREDGITDQVISTFAQMVSKAGAKFEHIRLRDYPIEFCLNCRECAQKSGIAPGKCVLDDGLNELVEKIENADVYILASPTNFGSVTALFKRFMERLIVYGYWPWGEKFPKFRKADALNKKAILISSSAAPGVMGRWMFKTTGQLKMTAKTIGAKPEGILFTGLAGTDKNQILSIKTENKIEKLVKKIT